MKHHLSLDSNQPSSTFQKPLTRRELWVAGPTTSPSPFVPSLAPSSHFPFLSSSQPERGKSENISNHGQQGAVLHKQ